MDIDATDTAILNVLQRDGRITNNDLAGRVNLSPSACLRRVRRLEDDGIIDRYAALVNHAAVDKPTTVFVQISLESQEERKLDAFEARVAECPEVISCHLMAGDSDYLVQVVCRDVADYERIHRSHFASLPYVSRLNTSFALRTVHSDTALEI